MNDKIFNNMMEVYNSLSSGISKHSTEQNLKEAYTKAVAPFIVSPHSLVDKPPDFREHPEVIVYKSHPDSSAKRVLAVGMHEDIKALIAAGYDYWIPFPTEVEAPDECRRQFEIYWARVRGPGKQESTAWDTFQYAWERLKEAEKNK